MGPAGGGQVREQPDNWVIDRLKPSGNLTIALGEGDAIVLLNLREKRTPVNRFKWWAFCRVFPFRMVRWNDVR